jgi:hypothetical protein
MLRNLGIQIQPAFPSLHDGIHILDIQLHNLAHRRQINHDAASIRRRQLSFDTGPRTPRNDRNPVFIAYLDRVHDVCFRQSEHDSLRRASDVIAHRIMVPRDPSRQIISPLITSEPSLEFF